MPYKKKMYRRRPRRRRRKTGSFRSGNNGRVVAFKNPSPLPVKFKALFRYSEPYIKIPNPADTFLGTYIFSANGVYDPNITGIGHQPSGFDQLMTMYDHFVVIGAKITVTFVNNDANDPVVVGIDVRDSINAESDSRVIIESGTAKYANLSAKNNGDNQVTMEYRVNPNRFLGRSKPLSDPNLKGGASGNPVEQCYFHVFSGNLDDQITLAQATTANIVIEYQTILIEPKPVGLS